MHSLFSTFILRSFAFTIPSPPADKPHQPLRSNQCSLFMHTGYACRSQLLHIVMPTNHQINPRPKILPAKKNTNLSS
ncbi:hypothetical protein QBC41DRAFT_324154, partial [Cercophora samala]